MELLHLLRILSSLKHRVSGRQELQKHVRALPSCRNSEMQEVLRPYRHLHQRFSHHVKMDVLLKEDWASAYIPVSWATWVVPQRAEAPKDRSSAPPKATSSWKRRR